MSTQLILGGVGAVVGSFFGMPALGFMVGTLLGSIIDPPKIQGPKIGDKKLMRSTYGDMIPYAWGHGRIGVNIIDQTDLEEHEEKSGGKGGPEVTNFTYSASFIALLNAKLPNRDAAIIGITHIFADGRLIWSSEMPEEPPCTIYYGTEDQEPDPTFEAINGVGRQPAYRGMAYLVFTDYFLTDFGNRIPNLEVVIYTAGGDIPWRVSTFDPWPQGSAPFTRTRFAATYEDGVITTSQIARVGGLVATMYVNQFDIQGNQIGQEVVTDVGYTSTYLGMVGNHHVIVVGAGTDFAWWQLDFRKGSPYYLQYLGGRAIDIAFYPNRLNGNYNLYMDGRIYTLDGNGSTCIVTWVYAEGTIPSGVFSSTPYVLDDTYNASDVGLSVSDGHVWVMVNSLPGVSPEALKLWKFDRDLNLITFWELPISSPDDTLLTNHAPNFHVFKDYLAYFSANGGENQIRVVKLNESGSPSGIIEDFGTHIAGGFRLHDLGGGLGIDDTGVYSLLPPPAVEILSNIVDDLASLTPATSYDNSELTDEVRWFLIGSQMTVRNALDKLRPIFFFDVVEEDYSLIARKRGNRAVVPFDDDDLCARPDGEEPGDPLKTIRKREQELPRTITLTYIDVDSDWQTGAQSSPRQTTLSEYDVTLECPVGLTAEEAAQKCWTIQAAEWNERESFEWSAPRWYDYVTPCTLARVRGRIIRVRSATMNPMNGVIAFEGVLAAPSLYTQVAPGAIYAGGEIEETGGTPGGSGTGGGGGGGSQEPPASKVDTYLVLLDIPVLSQGDAPFGFYAAMTPAAEGAWASATLYKSLDGGVTYAAVAQATTPAIIGFTAESPLGSPTIFGTLATYAGGDVVDESEICVILGRDDDQLSSITAGALVNGGNLCAISRGTFGSPTQTLWEIVGVRDCVLIGNDTFGRPVYRLKGFLRGRIGTLTTGHNEGDVFVFLPSVVNVDAPESELNRTFQYKAVTSGKSVADAGSQDFTNTGESSEEWHDVVLDNLDVFVGACGSPFSAKKGLVPAPTAAMCSPIYYLGSDGQWHDGTTLGGGSSTVSDFVGDGGSPGGGVHGLVPAPAGGDSAANKLLHAGGTWRRLLDMLAGGTGISVSGTNPVTITNTGAPSTGGGAQRWNDRFGNGSDGVATCDGSTAVAGMSRVGSVYTLTRAVQFTTLTLDAGVSIKHNNIGPLTCSVEFIWNGVVDGNGNNGTLGTGGAGVSANYYASQPAGGNAGGVGSGPVGRCLGGAGGAGGAASGGTGGLPAGGGPAGGTMSAPSIAQGGLYHCETWEAALHLRAVDTNSYGGGSGGGGGQVSAGQAGAGGAAGAMWTVLARTISGSGTARSNGGNGSAASGATGGGGGGGGGGVIWVVTTTTNWESLITITLTGGLGGAGTGAGRNGLPGADGVYFSIILD